MNVKTHQHRLVLRPLDEGLRQDLYDIIFESDTTAGKAFDIGLLVAILTSVVIVSLETVPGYETSRLLFTAEWLLTILFTIEYGLRLACVRQPLRYAMSFWGLVDLLSILPSYLNLLMGAASARSFVILRSIRLLRVFRILKLWRMMSEAEELSEAIRKSRHKIIVFLTVVLVAVSISGTLMYYVETVLLGHLHESDFTSIPQAMYWAIVTMTTVGYGDVVPHTTLGKILSAVLILLGYSLIIVPTGFVSAELSQLKGGRGKDAVYCESCGARLDGGS